MSWSAISGVVGARILVTRPSEVSDSVVSAISARGAVAIELPLIGFGPPADPTALDDAVRVLSSYDLVVLSSKTAVRVLADVAHRLEVDLTNVSFAAVGHATATDLRELGVGDVLVPERQDGDGLLELLVNRGVVGRRVLYLRAKKVRDVLVSGLLAVGADVHDVVAYETRCERLDPAVVARLLAEPPSAVFFFSPSAVECLFESLGGARARELLDSATTVAVGPVTSARMAELEVPPDCTAVNPDVNDMLDLLENVMRQC